MTSVAEGHLAIDRHSNQAAAILEPERRAVQRTERIPIGGRHGRVPAVVRSRRRVRRDAQRIGTQRLEARERGIEVTWVVEIEVLRSARGVELDDPEKRTLEGATIACPDPNHLAEKSMR